MNKKGNGISLVNQAFTLIELLVVIAIIGILAAMATVSFTSAQKQARDTTRKSDLAQYRTALESFANKNNGLYPVSHVGSIDSTNLANLCSTLGITNCPDDPKASSGYYKYRYISEAGNSVLYAPESTKYVIWAKLENTTATTYWVVCSTGSSGKFSPNYPTTEICPTLTP
jgi:prepilin-type N-terminal cleavage/methylation domain-containing protein